MSSAPSPGTVYLDSVIVIYFVEGPSSFQVRAQAHLTALKIAGYQLAVSELTRLECRVKPLRQGNIAVLADFDAFFAAADLVKVPIPSAVFERATSIRAIHNFKLGDSLHLAAAMESGCARVLTNDLRLASFPHLAVEVLP